MNPATIATWKQKLGTLVDYLEFSEDGEYVRTGDFEEIQAFAGEVLKSRKDWLRAVDIFFVVFNPG